MVLVVGLGGLVVHGWSTITDALTRIRSADPLWLSLAIIALGAGFLSAGQIYGQVLHALGFRARYLWLCAAAMVSILISQTIPAGTVASYAFLTASMRKRGVPPASVTLIAGLELLSWIGAMLVLFAYGLFYMLVIAHETIAPVAYSAAIMAVMLLGGWIYIGSRPIACLHTWSRQITRLLERVFGTLWDDEQIDRVVHELDVNRRLLFDRPRVSLRLIGLQLIVFILHSLALMLLLHSLGVVVKPAATLAAYGLALIVGTFTALPGGGGTVEAALTLTLVAQGVPPDAALGTSLLFRLLNFWLLLPVGAIAYRLLVRDPPPARRTH